MKPYLEIVKFELREILSLMSIEELTLNKPLVKQAKKILCLISDIQEEESC